MKATGIVRRIDDLGRVVIPKEIRRTMRIREGDPLEIYTEKDGEVIFKKYSPMGGILDFSAQICESLGKTTGLASVITDRDSVIAVSGAPRRELMEKRVSRELEQIMEDRQTYLHRRGAQEVYLTDVGEKHLVSAAVPIISQGDLMGCVVFLAPESGAEPGETCIKLAQMSASFLGRHMEE